FLGSAMEEDETPRNGGRAEDFQAGSSGRQVDDVAVHERDLRPDNDLGNPRHQAGRADAHKSAIFAHLSPARGKRLRPRLLAGRYDPSFKVPLRPASPAPLRAPPSPAGEMVWRKWLGLSVRPTVAYQRPAIFSRTSRGDWRRTVLRFGRE